jgi:general secretion pathway protein K
MTKPFTKRARIAARARQRGAAILLAMLIMTLVATLAAGMVWLQWRGIEVESAERARGQGEWLLNAALDWGNLILKSSVRNGHPDDDLTQPWATPLADTKLSSFLSADGTHQDDSGPEAFLSGQITDAQSKYNLFNLVSATDSRNEAVRLAQLCTAIGVDPNVAATIASGLTEAFSAQTQLAANPTQAQSGTAALMPATVADLTWLGVDPAVLKQLEPFVTIFPNVAGTTSGINANTAPAEVIMAAFPGMSLAQAQQAVQRRQQKPFISLNDATGAAGIPAAFVAPTPGPLAILGFQSSYFEVYGQLRYQQHVIRERSLVHRELNGVVTVLHRDRLPPGVQ